MRDVAIIGIAETKFGELWEKSFREIGIEAGLLAINDAKISGNDVEALYVGNMSAGRFIEQEHIAPLILDYAGLADNHIPTTRIEGAGASGGLALYQGYMAVASGAYDIVAVGGAEKMTDVRDADSNFIMAATADQEWETVFGATYAGLYAMMAKRHMHMYGTTREQMASVAVKNHLNASMNPIAHYRNKITVETVLRSPMVASPLGMFDCAPISDGAASVILCPLDKAASYTKKPIKISGVGQASDRMALHNRKDITTMGAVSRAAKWAYKKSGKKPEDVKLAEVHDSFTISEIMAIEDLGMCKKGEGGKMTENGETAIGGKIPVNTSGGLKAKGQPFGAIGVAQAVEIAKQLRGDADARQVKGADVGLTLNVGGTGATAIVHILEAV